jgi:chromodomain-helicase-DNA-binding protein 7
MGVQTASNQNMAGPSTSNITSTNNPSSSAASQSAAAAQFTSAVNAALQQQSQQQQQQSTSGMSAQQQQQQQLQQQQQSNPAMPTAADFSLMLSLGLGLDASQLANLDLQKLAMYLVSIYDLKQIYFEKKIALNVSRFGFFL